MPDGAHLQPGDVARVHAALRHHLGVEVKVQHLAAVQEVIEGHLRHKHTICQPFVHVAGEKVMP